MQFDPRALIDHLDAKVKQLEAELSRVPARDVATNASISCAAIVLNALSVGIEKATKLEE